MKKVMGVVIWGLWAQAFAQTYSVEQAIQTGLQNNLQVQASAFDVKRAKEMKTAAWEFGKFSAVWMNGNYNSIYKDNNFTFSQTIPFPTTLFQSAALAKAEWIGAEKKQLANRQGIVYQIKKTHNRLLYFQQMKKIIHSLDTLLQDFSRMATRRHQTGEANWLEQANADLQSREIHMQQEKIMQDELAEQAILQALMQVNELPQASGDWKPLDMPADTTLVENADLQWWKQQVHIRQQNKQVERSRLLPDLSVGFFNQTLQGNQVINGQDVFFGRDKKFTGFTLGVSFPLFAAPQVARARAAYMEQKAMERAVAYQQKTMRAGLLQVLSEVEKNQTAMRYYQLSALPLTDEMKTKSRRAYQQGDIGYIEYMNVLQRYLAVQQEYVKTVEQYNQAVLLLEYMTGKNKEL